MQTILDYEIQEKLAEKKHCHIFKCRDKNSNQDVIVTQLKPLAPSPTEIARFRQEFEHIKKIRNDSIQQVYHVFEFQEGFVIVQQYIPFRGTKKWQNVYY